MVRQSRYEISWKNQKIVDDFLKKHKNKCVGIDEVGRGALAGPIIVGAVAFKTHTSHILLTDSKLLSPWEREKAKDIIESHINFLSFQEISSKIINSSNKRLNELIIESIHKILDIAALNNITGAFIDWLEINHPKVETLSLERMELLSSETAAASILAKIKRDKIMMEYDSIYPGYNFHTNKGYGTQEHLEFLKTKNLSPIHRKYFTEKAIKKYSLKGKKNVK